MLRAVLLLCVCFLSYSASEYVLTPFGYHRSECVHFVDEDEVASFDDVDELFRIRKRVLLENGEEDFQIVQEYPRCPERIRARSKSPPAQQEPNGWAADAYWLTQIKFTEFGGIWSVPDYPSQEGVQTLFLFTGLQNSETVDVSIIQPVLQWGDSDAGSSKNWTMASWFVSESHASYSKLTGPLQPGDTIVGNMTTDSNSNWVITTADTTNGLTTTLTARTGVNEVDAFVTLEVYGISSCEDYPNGQVEFTNLWLESSGTHKTPVWKKSTEPGCDESVTINSATDITIKF